MTHTASGPETTLRDALTRAQDYIRTEYTRPTLTVAEVAGAAGCTPTHLAHIFRARLNTSVRRVIITRRLERAQALLAEGRYQVKEAAYLTGWRSPFHFSNAFVKHFARRPSTAIQRTREPRPAAG
jgi:AraC-like DNA-binding protein